MLLPLLTSCSESTAKQQAAPTSGGTTPPANTTDPAVITLSASTTVVISGDTVILTASVLNAINGLIADGTTVNFSINDQSYGSITASATTTSGVAEATFTASGKVGSVTIYAFIGSLSTSTTVTIQPKSLALTANPKLITISGTSSIQATVLDVNDSPIADGNQVSFDLSDADLGTITAFSTTSKGIATATFTASTATGTVTITATIGSLSSTVIVSIIPAEPASIEFSTAAPQIIGIKGSGQTENSKVAFLLKDINGNPVMDGMEVDLCLKGPSGGRLPQDGGEYIVDMDDTKETFTDANGNGCYDTGEDYTDDNTNGKYDSPVHATVSTVGGAAIVNLVSGKTAGNVVVMATLKGTVISTSSPVLSIGGGIPSEKHISLVTSLINLPGLSYVNETATISLYVADRFGNANVLAGTTASFYAESGATETSSAVLGTTGATSVTFRTQAPDPQDVLANGTETALIARMFADYGIVTTRHPRDGWATITATITGEEAFNDLNGNGIYDDWEDYVDANSNGKFDPGETYTDTNLNAQYDTNFTDTIDEPFVDYNDSGAWNDGYGALGTVDPWEPYTDSNGDGSYTAGPNGIWDSNKVFYKDIALVVTGPPAYIKFDIANNFNILADGSQLFNVVIADINLNTLISGTTIKVSASKGILSGTTDVTLGDGLSYGPTEISFVLSDPVPGTATLEPTSISVEVTWKGMKYGASLNGTVN